MVSYPGIDGGKWAGMSQHARVVAKWPVVWLLGWPFSLLWRNFVENGARAGHGQQRLTIYYISVLSVD